MTKQNRKIFVISDLHFGHKNILKHRTQFKTLEEHDNHIIDNWNRVVKPEDKVYVLGDVAWKKSDLAKIAKLNGTKVLVAGNHDWHRTKDYLSIKIDGEVVPLFKNVRGLFYYDALAVWLSHAPIHPDHLRGRKNIHGHLHDEVVERKNFFLGMLGVIGAYFTPDDRYINVSCEQVNYTPVEIKELMK